jgi:hypothetical protein
LSALFVDVVFVVQLIKEEIDLCQNSRLWKFLVDPLIIVDEDLCGKETRKSALPLTKNKCRLYWSILNQIEVSTENTEEIYSLRQGTLAFVFYKKLRRLSTGC